MMPDDNPYPHRNSTLFTKKHTNGRLSEYNKHVFKMQKIENKRKHKYIMPSKPVFNGPSYLNIKDASQLTADSFTAELL